MSKTFDNDKQLKFGIVLSYVQLILVVLIGMFYTPFAMSKLGTSEFGVYQTCKSAIEMLNFLTLGMNSGYIKFYTEYKRKGDDESIYKLNGLYLTLFVIMGAVALVLGLVLTNNLQYVFQYGLTASEIALAKSLMYVISINLFITFINLVFTSIISAHEKYIFLRLFTAIQTIASPLTSVLLLNFGLRSKAMACTVLTINLCLMVIYFFYATKVLKQKFIFKNFEKGLLKSIFVFSSFLFINILVDSVNYQSGKVIVAAVAGSTEVAIYSVGALLLNYYMNMSLGISEVFTPRIHKLVLSTDDDKQNQRKEMTRFFTDIGRIQYMLLFLILSGFVFFGKPFLSMWVGEELGDGYITAYYVTIILFLGNIVDLIQNVGIEFQRSQNKHMYAAVIYAIAAAINIVISIFLARAYGSIGAALGTSITMIVSKGVIMNVVYDKTINIDVAYFWKNILKITISVSLALIYGIIVLLFINIEGIVKLGIFGLIYVAIYCLSLWFVGMKQEEKEMFKGLFHKN